MDLAGYVINVVLVEGRSVRDVCEAHGISRSWLDELIGRYRETRRRGAQACVEAARFVTDAGVARDEDEIVALRKELTDCRLRRRGGARSIPPAAPSSRATQLVFRRWLDDLAGPHGRGFVTPQPHKRPRARGSASKPTCPTSAGRPTSPTGTLADGPTSRS